jgi:monofunctional biosynthetic peptidoglycan transglycosylase
VLRFLGRLLRWTLWAGLGFAALSAGAVLALRFLNPPTSAFMIAAQCDAWFGNDPKPFHLRQEWRDISTLSPQAAIAVVASEDQQFPQHSGFDVGQIRKAIAEAESGRRARGASTITQQTAKNLFLWSGHSFLRKGLEAWFTVLMEALWPKQRILEVYLNIAEFGRGLYGVQAASRAYFHHDARTLSASEAALLAAVLPNPIRLRADAPSRYVQGRQREIMGQMQALGGSSWLKGVLPRPTKPPR